EFPQGDAAVTTFVSMTCSVTCGQLAVDQFDELAADFFGIGLAEDCEKILYLICVGYFVKGGWIKK
ncbi:MAG: hypothetical protein MJZ20_14615, partial [Bacteroidaceae bacterium]|nr:hypothetical protein [Bacteroidaceae bacterium]